MKQLTSKYLRRIIKEELQRMTEVSDPLSDFPRRHADYFQRFIDLAKNVKDASEFKRKVQQWHDVPSELSDWFFDTYAGDVTVSIEDASREFIQDVEDGKYRKIDKNR